MVIAAGLLNTLPAAAIGKVPTTSIIYVWVSNGAVSSSPNGTSLWEEGACTQSAARRHDRCIDGRGHVLFDYGRKCPLDRHHRRIRPQTNTPAESLQNPALLFAGSAYGALLFGYPLSAPLKERNGDGTGRSYLVQYFQNARLEYHPEPAGTGNEIELGLLGKEALKQRGWL